MSRILILFTGGTIASVKTENGLEPLLTAGQILSYLPDLGEKIALDTLQICNLDSTDMDSRYWLKLVSAIEENYQKYDGFVICHGTDTMAYTAAALSYLIQHSSKPIVMTGSQQPISQEITDAKRNLRDSILYAADGQSQGVCLLFDGRVIAGTRAKKTHTFSNQAFSSINFPTLAVIQHGSIVRYIQPEPCGQPVQFYHCVNPDIYTLKLTPGVRPAVLRAVFEVYDCIIVESFGVGGLPHSILEPFCQLMQEYGSEKIVVMTTQVTYEGSSIFTYQVGQRIRERFPCLEALDMNFEAVLTKMMWILGQGKGRFQEVEELFYKRVNYDIMMEKKEYGFLMK